MGSMLRSDKMSFCEMFIQPEAAFGIFCKLGEQGNAQIEDMTPELSAFQRNYISELCRCAELERILMYLEAEMKSDNIPIPHLRKEPPALHPNEMIDFENMLEKWEHDITEMAGYQKSLLINQKHLQEMQYVYRNINPILGGAELHRQSLFFKSRIAHGDAVPTFGGKLHVFTGVVRRSRCYSFESMLWRVARGNVYFRTTTEDLLFEKPTSGQMVRKVAFVAVCQGSKLKTVFEKVCSGFHTHMYPCPLAYAERLDMLDKLDSRINDIIQVIRKTKFHRCKQLRMIGRSWENWTARVKKAKAVYYHMNHFSMDITRKCLIGQCWLPTADLRTTHDMFETLSCKSGSKVKSFITLMPTIEEPPTYHRTNKFTKGFQNLITAYGDSMYRELNPGLYTIITFPFLFAVMFGDAGHATIMFLFAFWMLIREKKFLAERSYNEIWNIFFAGRYVIFLMSIFSLYTGFLYNDWFSKPMKLKENYWVNQYSADEIMSNERLALDPARKTLSHYSIGVDPAWALSTNKIRSENSLKMKMSVILGIVHMMFGLVLSLFNHIQFKKYYAIILEFIPQMLFLSALFVWLVILIVYKWIKYGPKETDIKLQPGCAPFILILFIDMCLMRETKVEEDSPCDAYMFNHQRQVQQILLIVGLANVPIMLFGSPIYLYIANKSKRIKAEEALEDYLEKKKKSNNGDGIIDKTEACLRQKVHHYSESFSELMIHQGVHTIEYVLSTISHTASYLRLWALSLAHAQLSEMLWNMVLSKLALKDFSRWGSLKIFIIFSVWASFSMSVLVLMEGLSAFLHTLRLHWVEFMSKFFLGTGKVFRPFSFKEIIYGDYKEDRTMEATCGLRKKKH